MGFQGLAPPELQSETRAVPENNWGNLAEGTFWMPWNGSSHQEKRDFVLFMAAFPLPSTQDAHKVIGFSRGYLGTGFWRRTRTWQDHDSAAIWVPKSLPGRVKGGADAELLLTAALPARPAPGNCPQEQRQPPPRRRPTKCTPKPDNIWHLSKSSFHSRNLNRAV